MKKERKEGEIKWMEKNKSEAAAEATTTTTMTTTMSETRRRKGISQCDAEKTLFTIKHTHKTARAAGSYPLATTTAPAESTQSGRKFAHFICAFDLPYSFDFISWLMYTKCTNYVGVCVWRRLQKLG